MQNNKNKNTKAHTQLENVSRHKQS